MKPFVWSILTTVVLSASAYANSTLHIHNKNDTSISLRLLTKKPGGFNLSREIPAKTDIKITLDTAAFKGEDTYDIQGETHLFIGDKCKNLHLNQDYDITFTNDRIGTTCHAERLNSAL